VEGSISGLIASVVFSVALAAAFQAIARAVPAINPENVALPPLWAFAILGLFAGALSQIGDLTASMIKRDCGIKDFGSIFPGHGGMMDRFDGILFCAAVCWMFFRFFGL
ncbi:MAG: phosphatidate cytidylyltransferase, partial [Clostridia bacterium]|nr:phosphatidate cytidylyltransferase [Clostridia bacterium]